MSDILKEGSKKLGIDLSDAQIDTLIKYKELLVEWNEKINLTAITDDFGVYTKHFLDSLTTLLTDKVKGDVIDVGTGAGFPGLVLKIAKPEINLTLLDSLNKRINFLNEVINQLGLKEIEAIHGRAADAAKSAQLSENFDLCVSRAVANLSTLSEYCLPFTNVGGYFVSYKSGEVDDELETAKKAISILGGRPSEVEKFVLGDSKRSFVCVEKVKNTPNKFPRKAGTPKNEPIS